MKAIVVAVTKKYLRIFPVVNAPAAESHLKLKKIDIAFDLDSVLVDPMPVFAKVIKRRYNGKIVKHDSWHIYTDPELTMAQFLDSFREVYHRYSEMPILKGARRLLNRLGTMAPDDPIRIITARRHENATDTYNLIKERLVHGAFDLSLAPGEDKSKYLCHHHYFIEDRAKNALSLAENGIIVYLPDCPWNQHLKPHPNINRIKGIYELLPGCENFIIEV